MTREHMPPKALFNASHRPDKLVMPACDECNRGTSTSDLVASIVARWNYNSTEAELADHHRLVAQVRMHHRELLDEWNGMDAADKLAARQHLENYGVSVPLDAGMASIGPLTIRQLNLFAHKVVLALYFEIFRAPLPNTGRVAAYWRTKEDFARDGIPEELLNMMRQYGTLEQGKWNASDVFEYRYDLNEGERLFACLTRFRGGLFVSGFAVADAAVIEHDIEERDDDIQWIKPSDLIENSNGPDFQKRI